MSKQHEKKYFAVEEIFKAAVDLARTDPKFAEAEKDCALDYDMVCSSIRGEKLTRCEFEVIGITNYGTSEGIYGDLYLYGSWNEQTMQERGNQHRRVYVLKTLECNKDAYLAMGTMVSLICYYANEFVGAHLNRFD